MNRRTFFWGLATVAASHRVSGRPLNSSVQSARVRSQVELKNGPSRLALVPGKRGYGIQLFAARAGAEHLAAATEMPIAVFYGPRTSGTVDEVAFDRAARSGNALKAGAEFTDSHGNQWRADFTAELCENHGFRCRYDYQLLKGSAQDVFFEHPFHPATAPGTERTYVLMPGLLYDGNRLTVPSDAKREIPQLTAAEDFAVDTPVLTLAIPLAAFQDKQDGLTFLYVTEPTTDLDADMTGFHCIAKPDGFRISITAPCYREKGYHHYHYEPETPRGATVEQGRSFKVPAFLFAGVYPDRPALFRAVEVVRQFVRKPFQRTNRLPLSAAARLVENNFNARQWCNEGFYINAMKPDFSIAEQGCGKLIPGWQLLTGWCAGAISGYALLKMGDETSRTRARAMFDLISTGLSPSGLFWSVYANGEWDPARNSSEGWKHMRMPADATFYFLKALDLEASRHLDHANWRQAVISNLDAFVKLWHANGDFGWRVDCNTLEIVKPGTAAGALCIGGLALGGKLPRAQEYLAAAREAADAYFERCVKTGWIDAGPLDIPNAPDSESATALLESYVTLYEATRDAKYLEYARETAYQLATWVVAYNANFPRGTVCDRLGIQTVGGVLANAQNHHIGPSFCTNSGSMLFRLYQYTGEARWLRLIEDVVSGLPQYVCTREGIWPHMKPGMVTEQFDMSDEIGHRGDAPEVSASWPETCVLLSYADLPSIYVDAKTRTLGVLDQIEADADWPNHTLHLANPTTYPAAIRILESTGAVRECVLAPGAHQSIAV